MTVHACEKDRIIRRDFIQILPRWKLRRFPKRFDPAATGDPFPALGSGNALLHFGEKILTCVRAFEVEIHLASANPEDVAMRIGQAGYNSFSGKIDNVRFVVGEFLRVCVRADKDNSIFFDRDGLGARLMLVDGVDVSVNENKIDNVRAVHFLKKAKQENKEAAEEGEKGTRFHLTLR